MNKLTAEKCKDRIQRLKGCQTSAFGLSIDGEYQLQALEIALPALEGRIASSALPKEVFDRLYDQYLMGVICGKGNKSAAKNFLNACVIALYDCQPQASTAPQIDSDAWIEWKGGYQPVEAGVEVEFEQRDGEKDIASSSCLDWSHEFRSDDIIAYRVIENDGREG